MSAWIRGLAMGATLLALGASPAHPQWSFQREKLAVTPGLVGEGTDVVPALRLAMDVAFRGMDVEGCYPRRGSVAVRADAPLTPPQRWGFVEVSAEASIEALQELEDADLTLAASLAYEHDQDRLWFLPAFTASFGFVDCVGCSLPEEEDAWARRMDLMAAWSIPLRALMPEPLDPLRLRATGRWFAAGGMGNALKAVREDVGAWGALELAYQFPNPGLFQEVHVGWRGGQLPQRLAKQDAWTAGVTVVL